MHHFYHEIIMNVYLLEQNVIKRNEEAVVIKTLFWIYYQNDVYYSTVHFKVGTYIISPKMSIL